VSAIQHSEVVLAGPNGEPLIRKTPGVCGGDACIRFTRIPVWLLVEYRRIGTSDQTLLEAYPDSLTQTDLDASWAYFAAHPQEIERNIWENQVSDVEREKEPLPVWLVVTGQRLGLSDEQISEAFFPPLSPQDLEAARDYYRRHPQEIEQEIRRNEAR